MPPGPVRGHPGRLLGAALGYLLTLGLTGLVFVRTSTGQQLDGVLVPGSGRSGGYPPPAVLVEPAKTVLAMLGNTVVMASLLCSVLVLGALRRRLWAGAAGVGLVLCSVALASILKLLITRPDLDVDGSTTHNSFPSGHVSAAMGLLLAFMLVLPVRTGWWLALPGAAGVSVVASATMIAGWHRFSDAVGAVALAAMLYCLAAAALTYRRRMPPGSARRRGAAEWTGWLTALAGPSLAGATAAALATRGGLLSATVAASWFTVSTVLSLGVLLHGCDPARTGSGRPRPMVEPVAGPDNEERSDVTQATTSGRGIVVRARARA